MVEVDLKAKAVVLSAIKALTTKDKLLLDQTMYAWSDDASELLKTWCVEATTKLWVTFDERDLFGIKTNAVPLDILRTVNALPKARSYLQVKVALQVVMDRNGYLR